MRREGRKEELVKIQTIKEWFKEILSALAPSCPVKQVFKELEFLGWYTTGGPPDPSDIHVHKQVYMLTCVHAGEELEDKGKKKDGALTSLYIVPLFQVCEIIESPLFLKLNPMTKHTDVSIT